MVQCSPPGCSASPMRRTVRNHSANASPKDFQNKCLIRGQIDAWHIPYPQNTNMLPTKVTGLHLVAALPVLLRPTGFCIPHLEDAPHQGKLDEDGPEERQVVVKIMFFDIQVAVAGKTCAPSLCICSGKKKVFVAISQTNSSMSLKPSCTHHPFPQDIGSVSESFYFQ